LLSNVGYAWVALLDGEIVGEAEAFLNHEPLPLGRYLNISVLYVHREAQRRGAGRILVEAVQELALQQCCQSVLVGDVERRARAFYSRLGFSYWRKMRLAEVSCELRKGRGRPIETGDYDQVAGLPMPVGRYQGAGQEWQRMRAPPLIPPSLGPLRLDWRLLDVDGESVWTAFSGDLFDPSLVAVRAWSRATAARLLPALIAEAGALGYERVEMLLEEDVFARLQVAHGLREVSWQEAWWYPLSGEASKEARS
jgi:GNAT superfamily N-acetyltransferase